MLMCMLQRGERLLTSRVLRAPSNSRALSARLNRINIYYKHHDFPYQCSCLKRFVRRSSARANIYIKKEGVNTLQTLMKSINVVHLRPLCKEFKIFKSVSVLKRFKVFKSVGYTCYCLPLFSHPLIPPHLLDFQTELEEHFSDALLFRTLVPTQTHSSHLMEHTQSKSYTHIVSSDLNLSLHSVCDAARLNWTAECVQLFVFLYSSDPDVKIPLEHTVVLTLIQIQLYMEKDNLMIHTAVLVLWSCNMSHKLP